MASPDRGTSPIPGESTLGLYVMLFLALTSGIALIAVAIWGSGGPTLWGLVVLTGISVVGLVFGLIARAHYLARVRNGDVIEREPWSGADIL